MNFSSLIPWAKKDTAPVSLRDLLGLFNVKGAAGVNVNWQTALQAVTALACARVIAEGLAQIPLKLYQERADGGNDSLRGDKLYRLVNSQPNDYCTSYEWRETMGLHLVFAGNAYNIIVRVGGDPVELLPLNPRNVTVKKNGYTISYEVQLEEGKILKVAAENMLHIRGISWDSAQGLDGVKLAANAIGLLMATEEHGSRQFANGAQPNGMLSTDSNLTDPGTRQALRESWEQVHGGLHNVGKTALMWGGLKWSSTAQQNDQAQFLETRAFQVEEVCRWARVMPIMVGHADKSMTFASAEQIFLAHIVHTMGPWYARLEQAFDKALLSDKRKSAGQYFKFNVSALMRGSHESRANYYSKALGSGGSPAWMTQDEVRALDELNPMGGAASKLPELPKPAAPVLDPVVAKSIADLHAEIKSIPRERSGDIIVNNQQPNVSIKAGDTTLTMPEGMVKADIQVTTPEVKFTAGDVNVEPQSINVHVAHPVISTRTVKRDDNMEIEEIVTVHEF